MHWNTMYQKVQIGHLLNNIPSDYQIEIFLQHNILFNVTEHVKVPKHELIINKQTIMVKGSIIIFFTKTFNKFIFINYITYLSIS